MPTNKERREVADRFRDFETLRPIFKESNICAFLEALGVKGYCSWEDICEKLADLIEPEPERTCRPVVAKVDEASWEDCYNVECSECRHSFGGIFFSVEEAERFASILPSYYLKYCAKCGAKVVNDAD